MAKRKSLFVLLALPFVLTSCVNREIISSKEDVSSEGSSEISSVASSYSSSASSSSASQASSSFSSTEGGLDPSLESYYKGVSGTGYTLLLTLRNAISKNFKSIGYRGLWTAYPKTDSMDGVHINDYYSNITNYTTANQDKGSHPKEGSAYNREHSIPKSWWGGSTDKQGCDVYIVVPTDGYVNERRSNYPFGETKGESYKSANDFSKLGSSTFSGYSGRVFEPNDEWKGDFARITFYALTRWDASSWRSGEGSSTFSGSYSNNIGLTDYAKNLFLKWNALDPVSDYERHKNDEAQKIQGNRNPYVDNPSWVNQVWGK